MIQLSTLASDLETALNAEPGIALLNSFHANVEYRFVVHSDEGEYIKSTKMLNTLTKHINCILRVNGDEKAGVTDETVSAIWQCQFEALVPDINDVINVESEGGASISLRFVDAVEALINDTLAASSQKYVKGSDGIVYYVGANYSNTVAGLVDERNAVGESMPLAVYIDYTIVATGISSTDIKLSILNPSNNEYVRIYPTRLDMVRTSVQDGNLSSDGVGVSKVTTQGSLLQLNITMPFRYSGTSTYEFPLQVVATYILGAIPTQYHTYKLEIPYFNDGDDTLYMSNTYNMVPSNATISAETNLAASCTISLVEALVV